MSLRAIRIAIAGCMAILIAAAPYTYYRKGYEYSKRLREFEPGVLYRCGQLPADGLAKAIERYNIRTVVNLQNEAPDPVLDNGTLESDWCRQLGVKYVFIPPDLVDPTKVPELRPAAIDEWLKVMDDPSNFPVLLHCKAGLHRTGILGAIYRMEYQDWSLDRAIKEMKDHGFGNTNCHARNHYITQYLLTYQKRPLLAKSEE